MQECNEYASLVGRQFDDYSVGHRRMYEAGLVLLGDSHASVLDVGSGIGWGFKRGRELGHRGPWVGYEPCNDAHAYTVKAYPAASWRHEAWLEAMRPPIAEYGFCIEVIEHVHQPDVPAFVAKLRDHVTRALFLSTPEADKNDHGTMTRTQVCDVLRAAGFANVVVMPEQWTTLYIAQ